MSSNPGAANINMFKIILLFEKTEKKGERGRGWTIFNKKLLFHNEIISLVKLNNHFLLRLHPFRQMAISVE